MRKVEKLAAVIVLILLAFVYGHVHKTHAIYDRMIENDQYVMMDVSQDQISQEFVCEEDVYKRQDYNKLNDTQKEAFDKVEIGKGVIPQDELLSKRLPEMPSALVPIIEEIWAEEVVGK